jgi:hypothetical protein
MGFTARTKLAAVLPDPKPLAAFLTLSDGITVVPLALPLTSYVLHGASHAASPITDGPQLWRARRPSLTIHPFGDGGTVKPWAALAIVGLSLEPKLNRPINGRFLVTSPRAASGHAMAALPIIDMKSRRLMGLPRIESWAGHAENITVLGSNGSSGSFATLAAMRRASSPRPPR